MALTGESGAIQWAPLILSFAGGLALFLFGMEQLTVALRSVAGAGIRTLLARLTSSRVAGVVAGATVTAIIQSSSVTTVLVVGFVSSGVMTLSQAVGVILGSNVGSTVTAQIVAFQVTRAALGLLAAGFAAKVLARRESWRRYGAIALGLGLIFLGMDVMGQATEPLRAWPPFLTWMERLENPALGILVGAVFTALIQSSAATMAIVIALAGAGLVSLTNGVSLALGANVGTCITAWLAALDRPAEAKQAAMVHVLFNVLGVLVWLPFLGWLVELSRWISPAAPELEGLARLAAETPRQIANAHTLFNGINTVLFVGFGGALARLAQWMVPPSEEGAAAIARPRYLDDVFLQTPGLALDRVRLELGHLGQLAVRMVREAPPAVIDGTPDALGAIYRMDDDVDALHAGVVRFLGRLSQQPLSAAESRTLRDWLAAAHYIENIGDTIETNLVALGHGRIERGASMSEAARAGMRPLFDAVGEAVERSIRALTESDVDAAREIIAAKDEINRLADRARESLGGWLAADDRQRVAAFRIEADVIENLKRLYYFAKRIAKLVVEQAAASRVG